MEFKKEGTAHSKQDNDNGNNSSKVGATAAILLGQDDQNLPLLCIMFWTLFGCGPCTYPPLG